MPGAPDPFAAPALPVWGRLATATLPPAALETLAARDPHVAALVVVNPAAGERVAVDALEATKSGPGSELEQRRRLDRARRTLLWGPNAPLVELRAAADADLHDPATHLCLMNPRLPDPLRAQLSRSALPRPARIALLANPRLLPAEAAALLAGLERVTSERTSELLVLTQLAARHPSLHRQIAAAGPAGVGAVAQYAGGLRLLSRRQERTSATAARVREAVRSRSRGSDGLRELAETGPLELAAAAAQATVRESVHLAAALRGAVEPDLFVVGRSFDGVHVDPAMVEQPYGRRRLSFSAPRLDLAPRRPVLSRLHGAVPEGRAELLASPAARALTHGPVDELAALLLEAVGSDPTAWDTLAVLAEDWEGTLGELRGTAAALARPEAA